SSERSSSSLPSLPSPSGGAFSTRCEGGAGEGAGLVPMTTTSGTGGSTTSTLTSSRPIGRPSRQATRNVNAFDPGTPKLLTARVPSASDGSSTRSVVNGIFSVFVTVLYRTTPRPWAARDPDSGRRPAAARRGADSAAGSAWAAAVSPIGAGLP